MLKRRYTITEAADLLKLRTHTLRYWEEELELQIPRNEMGHRVYYEEQLELFKKIRQLKEQGFQLTAIRMQLQGVVSVAEDLRSGENEMFAQDLGVVTTEKAVSSKAVKLEQFQVLMNEIVKQAMEENNQIICTQVEERILKEMNYLMREQEEQARERYLHLDQAIRQLAKTNAIKKAKHSFFERKKETVTKCSPATNTL